MADPEMHSYAWNWFALHAGQRLQLVNFWLVSVAFLAAAFVQSQISHLHAIAAGLAVIGVTSSAAFQRLDARTRRLTLIAEDALRELETEWIARGATGRIALTRLSHEVRKGWLDSYQVVIQGLELTVAAVFLGAFIYALVN